MYFFLILFFAIRAAVAWIDLRGPLTFDAPWLLVLIVGAIVDSAVTGARGQLEEQRLQAGFLVGHRARGELMEHRATRPADLECRARVDIAAEQQDLLRRMRARMLDEDPEDAVTIRLAAIVGPSIDALVVGQRVRNVGKPAGGQTAPAP